jgi:2,3-bisphosphoglycerate-dependent phosphoglycerate mutase
MPLPSSDGPPSGIRTVPLDAPATPTRLVLIRHGEATCNLSGVCGGPLGCHGLTPDGVRQVEALRNRLGVTGELAGAGALYASVLPRAVETAELLAPTLRAVDVGGVLGPVPHVSEDCGLCELHPGEADGMTWQEFSQRFGDPDWDVDPDRPLAPGGESWTGFVLRVAATLDELATRHSGELVVVACHAGVIEASMLSMLPTIGGRQGARLQLRTYHASMTAWEVDRGRWRLTRYNDIAHLGIRA